MVDSDPLRCQKCGRPFSYVTVTAKSFLEPKPILSNAKLVGTCVECAEKSGLYNRNF